MKYIKNLLEHPLTRGLDIDDPQTTRIRKKIIQDKSFLKRLYIEWYQLITMNLPEGTDPILEVGSGAGFCNNHIPNLITSDLFLCPDINLVVNGVNLPFTNQSLRSIVMTNVLHHIYSPRKFFSEINRCVRPKGRLIMIEPWVSSWSRIVYRYFHHEPFNPTTTKWEFPDHGPLSSANEALPWIIFYRDREIFSNEYPDWNIITIKPMMPISYLLSGGISLRNFMPGFTFRMWRKLEVAFNPLMKYLAMFALIVLERN